MLVLKKYFHASQQKKEAEKILKEFKSTILEGCEEDGIQGGGYEAHVDITDTKRFSRDLFISQFSEKIYNGCKTLTTSKSLKIKKFA